jgi:hypothetical protein
MDVRTVSRWFGAASLVLGGVALTAGSFVESAGDDDSVRVSLSKIATHQGAQRTLIAVDLVAVLMLPAMLYLMRLARRGAPRLALAGGTLAFGGWLAGLLGIASLDVVYYHASRSSDREGSVRLLQAVTGDATYTVLLVVFLAGHVIGMLMLGAALWRARVAPRLAAALVAVAPIASVLVHDAGTAANAIVYAGLTIGLAGCAAALLRMPDAEWDLPVAPVALAVASPVSAPAVHATAAGG